MSDILSLDEIKEKKFNRMISIQACSAIVYDALEKIENYKNEKEVMEVYLYLNDVHDKLSSMDF